LETGARNLTISELKKRRRNKEIYFTGKFLPLATLHAKWVAPWPPGSSAGYFRARSPIVFSDGVSAEGINEA